jgi:plasmid maintenance system antidote protein VapI
MNTSNDCFVAALQYKLKEQGRGAKKKLAQNADVSPNHMSDILALRRNAGQQLKERIAQSLGVSIEEMLVLGRRVIESQGTIEQGILEEEQATGADKPSVSLMEMVTRILDSNTMYKHALTENIRFYYQALDSDQERGVLQLLQELREDVRVLRRDISILQNNKDKEVLRMP